MVAGIEELYGLGVSCDEDEGEDTGSDPCDTPTDEGCVTSDGGAY